MLVRREKKALSLFPFIRGCDQEYPESTSYEYAGMDDFVVKPVRLADLARVLSHLT